MFPQDGVTRRPFELEYGTGEHAVFNFFNTVYAWMATGLALTATVAWLGSQSPTLLNAVYGHGSGGYLIMSFGALGIAMLVQTMGYRISAVASTLLFLLYAAVIGALISGIFKIYRMETILSSFAITGGMFGGMSVYGFVTKRDLTSMGSFLIMGMWGLFLGSIVNFFVASSAFSWFITYGILAVFIGLTAYDTWKLKQIAEQTAGDAKLAGRAAIVGALHLYIDFINMFLSVLRIMGSKR
jgi:FtsH-binding integral membrane protein